MQPEPKAYTRRLTFRAPLDEIEYLFYSLAD